MNRLFRFFKKWFYEFSDEPEMLKDETPANVFYRAFLGGKRRCSEKEWVVLKNAFYTYWYSWAIVKDRWPEAEGILKNSIYWRAYLDDVKKAYEGRRKWHWLKEQVNENLIDILNYVGMDKEEQEWIILQRRDLIGRIEHLDPSLQEKYQFELELSRVDL
jgi:hypothetical protein